MSSKAQTSSSRSSASSTASAPNSLISLPSLSSALSALPQAKSLDSVALHPSSMSAQRAAESEAKLRKVLSKTASSSAVPQAYMPPPAAPLDSPVLMMRKPTKKIHA